MKILALECGLPNITEKLVQNNFAIESLRGDLLGTAYTPESEWIRLVTCKK